MNWILTLIIIFGVLGIFNKLENLEQSILRLKDRLDDLDDRTADLDYSTDDISDQEE